MEPGKSLAEENEPTEMNLTFQEMIYCSTGVKRYGRVFLGGRSGALLHLPL